MLRQIESELYGINVPQYIADHEADYLYEDSEEEDDDDDDDDDDENKQIIDNSAILGISPNYYANLERNYNLNPIRLEITAYRVKKIGGKKRKTRKTFKMRKNDKKRKRTRRYKQFK